MRVCILGSGGMLGHMLVRVLSETHDVYGTSKQERSATSGLAKFLSKEKWIAGVDAKDITTVFDFFEEHQFDVFTSAIGEKLDSRVDVVHPKVVFFFRLWGIYFDLETPLFYSR